MSKFLLAIRKIGLGRTLKLFLVSAFVLLSAIVSQVDAAVAKGLSAPKESSPNPPGQVQPYKGGMNNFDDVDSTRLNTDSVDARAKALKERVEQNIDQKGIDSVEQYVDNYRSGTPLNERIGNIGNDLRRGADETAGSVQELGERGSKNLEYNAKRAPKELSRVVDRAKENAKKTAKGISGDAR